VPSDSRNEEDELTRLTTSKRSSAQSAVFRGLTNCTSCVRARRIAYMRLGDRTERRARFTCERTASGRRAQCGAPKTKEMAE
jgi:hypothetical protein